MTPHEARAIVARATTSPATLSGRVIVTAAAGAVLALGLAACGNAHHPAQHAAKTPAVAATHSQSCADKVHAWAHDRGLAQLHQLSSDTTAVGKGARRTAAALGSGGDLAGAAAKWQATAIALQTDAQAAASNPPPACADAGDYGTAMQDYTTAAQDDQSAISDITSGKIEAAVPLVEAGVKAMNNGNSALGRATAAVTALSG